jgi:ribosomal protein S18 acetylase RimI-like enzyme
MDFSVLEEIAKIHKAQFKRYDVLSSCSLDAVKSFYNKVSKDSSTMLFTESINGRIAGFLYFAIGEPIQIRNFLKEKKYMILSNPASYSQLINSVLNKLLISENYKYENELIYIAVLDEFTGMGIARKLIKSCEDELKKRMIKEYYLQVFKKNTRAVKLYKALGFIDVKSYFRFGGSKVIMKKEIV